MGISSCAGRKTIYLKLMQKIQTQGMQSASFAQSLKHSSAIASSVQKFGKSATSTAVPSGPPAHPHGHAVVTKGQRILVWSLPDAKAKVHALPCPLPTKVLFSTISRLATSVKDIPSCLCLGVGNFIWCHGNSFVVLSVDSRGPVAGGAPMPGKLLGEPRSLPQPRIILEEGSGCPNAVHHRADKLQSFGRGRLTQLRPVFRFSSQDVGWKD